MEVRSGYVGVREAMVTQSQEAVRASLITHDSGGLPITVLLDNTRTSWSKPWEVRPLPPTSRSRRPPLTPNRGDGENK